MFERAYAVLALGVAVAAAPGLRAQGTSATADSLLAQVRVLDDSVIAHRKTVDSLRRTLVRPVSGVVVGDGAVHVRTDAALAPRVRSAVAVTSGWIERRGSAVVAARLDSAVLSVTRDSTRSIVGMIPTIAISSDTNRRWTMIGSRHVLATASTAAIADALAATLEQIALPGTDSALTAWIMLGRVPLRPATAEDAADAYTELATTESVALRRCRARDASACLDVLGIDSIAGSRLDRWYVPEDYRAVVRTVAPERDDSAAVAAWLTCRDSGDPAACDRAAHALPEARVPLAVSATLRLEFLRHVLDAGGTGAFDRLIATKGTLRERLAAASREPLERTALRWIDDVERARPDRMRLSLTLVIASLGWSGAIIGFALVRRSAWA